MSEILKPSNLSLTWAQGGDILNPGDTKYATGWGVEIPPRQWFNYLDNRQDEAIAHINQRGVAQWDSATEYQGVKSYVQGSNGTVYRSKQTNTNQEPVADVAGAGLNWQIAFASAGDFYTKAQTDAAYLAKANNLADLTNVTTAQTNLGVYPKSTTYTKTEVDSKITVASTAQAQGWTSNTTLLTPLRLAEAFQAANQSMGIIGYQKIPGNLIIQWGLVDLVRGASGEYSFPVAFNSGVFAILTSKGSNILTTTEYAVGADALSATTFRITNSGSGLGGGTQGIKWIAIGR